MVNIMTCLLVPGINIRDIMINKKGCLPEMLNRIVYALSDKEE